MADDDEREDRDSDAGEEEEAEAKPEPKKEAKAEAKKETKPEPKKEAAKPSKRSEPETPEEAMLAELREIRSVLQKARDEQSRTLWILFPMTAILVVQAILLALKL